jgi:hypothetical protein
MRSEDKLRLEELGKFGISIADREWIVDVELLLDLGATVKKTATDTTTNAAATITSHNNIGITSWPIPSDEGEIGNLAERDILYKK